MKNPADGGTMRQGGRSGELPNLTFISPSVQPICTNEILQIESHARP